MTSSEFETIRENTVGTLVRGNTVHVYRDVPCAAERACGVVPSTSPSPARPTGDVDVAGVLGRIRAYFGRGPSGEEVAPPSPEEEETIELDEALLEKAAQDVLAFLSREER